MFWIRNNQNLLKLKIRHFTLLLIMLCEYHTWPWIFDYMFITFVVSRHVSFQFFRISELSLSVRLYLVVLYPRLSILYPHLFTCVICMAMKETTYWWHCKHVFLRGCKQIYYPITIVVTLKSPNYAVYHSHPIWPALSFQAYP